MKKKILAVLSAGMALALAIGASGCTVNQRQSGDDSIGELTEKEGKITIWWPGSTVEMQAINQAKEDYIAENPKVEIEIIGQSTADFYSAYMLACTGNSRPISAYVDHVYVQTLAYYGYIANPFPAPVSTTSKKPLSPPFGNPISMRTDCMRCP